MSYSDDHCSPFIHASLSRYIEQQNEEPRTTITIGFESTPPSSPISPLRKSDEIINEYETRQIPSPKQTCVKHLSMAVISHQLSIRKYFQKRLSVRLFLSFYALYNNFSGFISDISCSLGVLGIVLMVIENEITFASINNRDTIISWFIKLIISITTIILVGLLIYYHRLNLKFYAAQNSLDDWRAGLTVRKIFLIIFEILICAIHPMPRNFPRNSISKHEEIKLTSVVSDSFLPTSVSPSYIAIDVALGLPSKYKNVFFIRYHLYIFI
jgi:hypothetical protein